MKEFRVIIAGSRNFTDYELLKSKCDFYLSNRAQDPEIEIIIVSGGSNGADRLGERYAKECGYSCEVYPADWERYGKSAGYKRNVIMADKSNALIAFRSAYSENKGTDMMIRIAKENRLLVRVIEEEDGN